MQGFIYSGEALKKGVANETFKLSGPILDNYYVVSAYRTAYSFDSKMSNLAEALLMASKNGKSKCHSIIQLFMIL